MVKHIDPCEYEFTITEVCKYLGRKVSPHMREILAEMVEEGSLMRRTVTRPNGMKAHLYRYPDSDIQSQIHS